MALDLSRQRCFNHARREAAACCPECGRYLCRECITEHDDRVVCADCLVKLTGAGQKRKSRLAFLVRTLQFGAGILVLWAFFYVMGEGLLALPSSFHEGSVWQTNSWEP